MGYGNASVAVAVCFEAVEAKQKQILVLALVVGLSIAGMIAHGIFCVAAGAALPFVAARASGATVSVGGESVSALIAVGRSLRS